jgi:hypothetical protein
MSRETRTVPRTCIFCGESPVTAEHVWPQWARRHLVLNEPQRHERTVQAAGEPQSRHVFSLPPFEVTVRAVCAACNSGWMSRLEQRAKPLLTELLAGRELQLSRTEQQLLATWGLKTVFMLDASFRRPTGVTRAQRRYLARTGAPPQRDISVWLAPYVGTQPGQFHETGMALSRPGEGVTGDAVPNVWIATLTFGPIVFHVAGSADPQALLVHGIEYGDLRLLRIWPYRRPFPWRPLPAFSDADLPGLVDALYVELLRHVETIVPATTPTETTPAGG